MHNRKPNILNYTSNSNNNTNVSEILSLNYSDNYESLALLSKLLTLTKTKFFNF